MSNNTLQDLLPQILATYNSSALKTALGSLYPDTLPQGIITPADYITYWIVGIKRPELTLSSKTETPLIQFSIYSNGKSSAACINYASALKDLFDDFHYATPSVAIDFVRTSDRPYPRDEDGWYQYQVDYMIDVQYGRA